MNVSFRQRKFQAKLSVCSLIGCSFIILLTFLAVPQQGLASTVADEWLENMASAMKTQSYRGVFVYSRGNISSSMKVIHRYKDGIERERLVQLDGEMGEILRTNDKVVCILPGNREISLEQSIPLGAFAGAFSQRLMPDKEHYTVKMKGEGRVAGLSAVKIAVMAKDTYRYSYLLWLEKSSGLLLKSLLLNEYGQTLELFHYTFIELADNIADTELQADKKAGVVFSHEQVPAVKVGKEWPEAMVWKIGWLPRGFMRLNASDDDNDLTLKPSHIQIFSDGLASFSVFIEAPSEGSMPEGELTVGATVAYVHRLKWKRHDYMVTVVGEVPVTTAMKVAETVAPEVIAPDIHSKQ
jgi:sigma-E factor negative regulatory protein RseB